MYRKLKKFWEKNNKEYLLEPMTAWFEAYDTRLVPEPKGIKGFIFENHLGLDNVKAIAGKGLYVYAMRHGDDWCEPADIENKEVVVNFYGYFITDKPLDNLFTEGRDWHDIFDWTMDWGEEYYWED